MVMIELEPPPNSCSKSIESIDQRWTSVLLTHPTLTRPRSPLLQPQPSPIARPISALKPAGMSSSSSTKHGGGSTPPAATKRGAPPPPPVPELKELRALLCDNPEAFQVPAFIDALVRPLLDQPDAAGPASKGVGGKASKAVGGSMDFGFDPAALTDLFSALLERLQALGKEVDGRVDALQEKGRRLAPTRRKELDRHHRQLQEVHGTIEDIEAHFRKVGLTAVRIGQSLSQTEAQRHKAEHAQRLLEYFLAFDTLEYESMLKDAEAERIEMLSSDTLAPLADEANFQAAAAVRGMETNCLVFQHQSTCVPIMYAAD